MRYLLALLLLLFTVPALATIAELRWTPPTTFESGDPLPPGYLTGYRIYWSVEGGASGEVDVGVDAGDSRTIASTSRRVPSRMYSRRQSGPSVSTDHSRGTVSRR